MPDAHILARRQPLGNISPTLIEQHGAATPQRPDGGSERHQGADAGVGRRLRRGVADTSAEAFHSLPVAGYLAPKERSVMALFTGPEVRLSRQQIAQALPMPINGVCGRVDSLLTGGHLQEDGERRDPATGKRQKLLQLPRAAQGDLVERGA